MYSKLSRIAVPNNPMRKAMSMYCTVQLVRTTRTIHYLAKGDWQVAIVDVRIRLKVVICTVTITC